MIGVDRLGSVHGFRELDAQTARRRGPAASAAPLLDVRELRVSFATGQGDLCAVRDASFQLRRGEVLALVGESGSGKSVSALTLMGLTRGPRASIGGSARLAGEELLAMSDAQLRRVRGRRMAMIFQDPQSSLNPVHRVGDQIAEQIRAHEPLVSRTAARARAVELMQRAGIDRARERARAYPHELSGGQRQRVMIAMALSLGASLLLADEPTTALDVTVQARILAELARLRDQEDLGVLLITHDFGIVAELADRVAVMNDGRIVEQGSTSQVLEDPAHPYTRGLLDALSAPRPRSRMRASGGGAAPLLEVRELRVSHRARGLRSGATAALQDVGFSLVRGETLAVVGESGCGKTTLLRTIAGLLAPQSGSVRLDGCVGMVFQDPQASLNPRRRIGATLERAVAQATQRSGARTARATAGTRGGAPAREQVRSQALELLRRVELDAEHASRYPHELSGGQRQRVTIARALAGRPALLLLDEPVSSLDASLRRGIFELLDRLQAELSCGYVVVSHDLGAVETLADRIAVMRAGAIVELGAAADVLERPCHPYTLELLAARPSRPVSRAQPANATPSSAQAAQAVPDASQSVAPDRVPSSVWENR